MILLAVETRLFIQIVFFQCIMSQSMKSGAVPGQRIHQTGNKDLESFGISWILIIHGETGLPVCSVTLQFRRSICLPQDR